ncbi:MAG: hypothetical protein C0515_00230 [Novosphingobium sp.]|nr:hypothetical protein [Novosphingobium sp.]
MIALGNMLGRSDAKRGLVAPCKRNDALQHVSQGDPCGAGQIGPIASLLVEHDASHRASPRALHWGQFGSVMTHSTLQGRL